MLLNQLWVFYHVAKHRSFSRAANSLCLSQPSVSNQVKLLEDSYGVKFFERHGRGITLTNSGEILLSYAERIFSLVTEADKAIAELKGLESGCIKISASHTLGAYYLPNLISLFRSKHPRVEIQLDVGYTETVLENVLNFKSDLGLVGRSVTHPQVVTTPLWEEALALIVSPRHPFARRRFVRLDELQDQPFIMSEKDSGVRQITERILSDAGCSPKVVMETGANEAIKQAVASGVGISIISATVARRELGAGLLRAVPLSGTGIVRQFSVIVHKDKYLSPLLQAFLDAVLHFQAAPEQRKKGSYTSLE
jgi:DNA-binding transcriptional LysR family regulator